MNILPVFHFNNNYEAQTALKIAKYSMDQREENLTHCLLREFGAEILFLKENNFPFLIVAENTLYDTNIELKDLELFEIFPRCHYDSFVMDDLEFFTDNDQKVKEWYKHIKTEFMQRQVVAYSAEEFLSLFATKNLDLPCFIKSKEKLSSYFSLRHIVKNYKDIPLVVDSGKLIFKAGNPDYYCEYREAIVSGFKFSKTIDCDIITSDLMNISTDDYGTLEYRCYIIHNKFINASRYLDYDHTEIPEDIKNFAISFAEQHTDIFPKHYVLDLSITDKGVQIVELNPIPQSGRYIDNNVEQLYTNLLKNNNYSCQTKHLKDIPEKDEEFDFSIFLKS